jgi:hypothetical protein
VISHEWGNDLEMLTTDLTYPWLFVTRIFRKAFEVMTST